MCETRRAAIGAAPTAADAGGLTTASGLTIAAAGPASVAGPACAADRGRTDTDHAPHNNAMGLHR